MRRALIAAVTAATFAVAACGDGTGGSVGLPSAGDAEEIVRQACGEKALRRYRRDTKGEGVVRKIAVARGIARDCQNGQ